MVTADDICKVLEQASHPLTVNEIASKAGGDIRECDALLWQAPERFVWRPGQRWTLANAKPHASRAEVIAAPDSRLNMMSAAAPHELRAFTLSSGITIAINRRPLDSDAFFAIRTAGNTITLTLNSMHEIFSDLPLPFDTGEDGAGYKELCEILLSAWALYEDGLPGGSTKRATEDARLLWGRRAIEMLRERDR